MTAEASASVTGSMRNGMGASCRGRTVDDPAGRTGSSSVSSDCVADGSALGLGRLQGDTAQDRLPGVDREARIQIGRLAPLEEIDAVAGLDEGFVRATLDLELAGRLADLDRRPRRWRSPDTVR